MKKLILFTVMFYVANGTAKAQTKSEKIYQYAVDHLDQKVGNGMCDELIIYAYREVCGCNVKKKAGRGKAYYSFGVEVPKDSIKAGDIASFSCFYKKTGKETNGHVGVVSEVNGEWIDIIHQNTGSTKRRNTVLDISDIGEIMEENPKYTYTVTFYRAY